MRGFGPAGPMRRELVSHLDMEDGSPFSLSISVAVGATRGWSRWPRVGLHSEGRRRGWVGARRCGRAVAAGRET